MSKIETVFIHRRAKSALPAQQTIKVVILARRQEPKLRAPIEINFIGAKQIKALNYQFRGIDQPTDVLSFAWNEETKTPTPSKLIGQIYLCPWYIRRQANRWQVSESEETVRMLTHGLLHVVGYDHHTAPEAKQMFALQETVVTKWKQKNI